MTDLPDELRDRLPDADRIRDRIREQREAGDDDAAGADDAAGPLASKISGPTPHASDPVFDDAAGSETSQFKSQSGMEFSAEQSKVADAMKAEMKLGESKVADAMKAEMKLGESKVGDAMKAEMKLGESKVGDAMKAEVKLTDDITSAPEAPGVKYGDITMQDEAPGVKVGDLAEVADAPGERLKVGDVVGEGALPDSQTSSVVDPKAEDLAAPDDPVGDVLAPLDGADDQSPAMPEMDADFYDASSPYGSATDDELDLGDGV